MKTKHYILYFILILHFSCATEKIIPTEKTLLQLNKIYVYDNGKDSIIKNFALYDSVKHMLPHIQTPEKSYFPMPGSTVIESLQFDSHKQGTYFGTSERNYEILKAYHDSVKSIENFENGIRINYIQGNKISFETGSNPVGGLTPNKAISVLAIYTGHIYKDSLVLTIHHSINGASMDHFFGPDSVRTYKLIDK